MPSLRERAGQLSALLLRQKQLAHDVDEIQGFQARAQAIEGLHVRLERALNPVRLLRRRGIAAIKSPKAGKAMEIVSIVQRRAESDLSSLMDSQVLAPLTATVEACETELQTESRDAWRAYCRNKIPPIDDSVLSPLAGIPALSGGVSSLRNGNSKLKALLESAVTESTIAAFDTTVTEVQAAWDSFDDGQIEPSVLAFIKDAAGRGAALESLTPDVLAWLGRHNIVQSFRIRVGSSHPS